MNQPTPQQPYQPYPPPPAAEPTPPAKKNRLWLAIGAAAALVLVVTATVLATLAMAGGRHTTAAPQSAAGAPAYDEPSVDDEVLPDPIPEVTTPSPGPTLSASDITLTPKVIDKQCYGSAGCNLTVRVVAKHDDDAPDLSEEETWRVTYQIDGGEDGPVIGNFEVTGKTYYEQEEDLSTKSSKAKISVKVVDVEKLGY